MAHLRRLPWLIAALVALVVAVVARPDGAVPTQPAAALEAPPLPDGSTVPGRQGAEASAIALADALLAVATGPGSDDICPRDRLEVSWKKPSAAYEHGAYLTPIGPAPDADTRQVNGVVLCDGSDYGFMGFEAAWDGERWTVFDIPYVGEEGHHDDEKADGSPGVVLPAGLSDIREGSPWYGRWGRDIEPLSAYEPQLVCDPAPKPGLLAYRQIIQDAYEFSRNLGISRACTAGARSEHKEGRAWDWGVAVDVPVERRAANEVISWLLATDEYGNRYAMARRLGIMYVIWDGHIWSSYAAGAGWRPYLGRSPHTDHVHLSFNRAGGMGTTSFWKGADLADVPEDAFAEFADDLGFPVTFFLGGSLPPPPELGPAARPLAPGGRGTGTTRGTASEGRRPSDGSRSPDGTRPDGGTSSDGDEVASPTGFFPGGTSSQPDGSSPDSGSPGTSPWFPLPGSTPTTSPGGGGGGGGSDPDPSPGSDPTTTTTLLPPLPLPIPTTLPPLPTTTTLLPPLTTTTTRATTTTTRRPTTTTTTLIPLPTIPLPTLPGL